MHKNNRPLIEQNVTTNEIYSADTNMIRIINSFEQKKYRSNRQDNKTTCKHTQHKIQVSLNSQVTPRFLEL